MSAEAVRMLKVRIMGDRSGRRRVISKVSPKYEGGSRN